MSAVETRLRWTVRCMALLRRTSRPVGVYPGPILTAGERKAMEVAYEAHWRPIDFARLLVNRDRLASTERKP